MATATMSAERSAQDRLFVNGEWSDAADGRQFSTLNPATGEPLADVAEGSAADIDRAVTAARAAFRADSWHRMDAADRGAILWRMADIIDRRGDALARIEVLDNGKPIREARIDIRQSVAALLRRVEHQAARRHHPCARQHAQLHAPRAGRRRRRHHTVEFPPADGRVEDRARTRVR
jgi:acyl-CoA reductase-like NAD-dependent aldehyde dehydrogenase